MHIPDGFIDAPTSAAYGAVAVAGVGYAVRRASAEVDDQVVPLAGLCAAFVFAGQMLNFPVALGTSGHLLGGVLAAVLVGPWLGAIAIAVVLLVQSLFADGGLTALGLNITNMAIVGALLGYLLFRLVLRVLPARLGSVPAAAGTAALVTVPLAAASFVLQFAVGGTVDLPLGGVTGAMLGVHVLIGIGEAFITAATVSLVVATRPDLVYGARHLLERAPLEIRGAAGVQAGGAAISGAAVTGKVDA
ncbi:energy-coupling factor ABC transporter permease [Frankia sp. CNm7]|uniref:Energy-coupling factor ABC transporter permease n=1 Tax=Frankia nepalensis TaxID=1836974 RepID=A0A937R728_9ACTN|nr:energy-coupling factor ABC transporter permease [Frankia nepalensis]MBL7499609.1 energy-coupling factor ABC transporter permease [Frankia nepalensis]MBL7515728.1 energy-coupling factor ABC transporter permease [Frankia nepalensis]MBL7520105.1 energy-coupling factor ABC transporter permease [Frankia nepalensis]MBL7626496.1 energy-coupling factor ABC transporter permease [Frankia nepalensis]